MPTKITANTIGVYESLIGKRIKEPILSTETRAQIDRAVANFTGRLRWEKWGLNKIKEQGSLVLLTGKPGTGKTTIARYLAKRVGSGFISLSMADIGSGDPGQTDRNIKSLFARATKEENTTIFLDECDALLVSRDRLGPDAMWMLTVINCLLSSIESYEGLTLMATNRPKTLDPALFRRISDYIEVSAPTYEVRLTLWEEKMPIEYPLKLKELQLEQLAKIPLTGAEIENCIIAEAKQAIVESRHPKFESLLKHAKSRPTS